MDDWKKDLTQQQLESVTQMEENVKDVLTNEDHDDFFVYRFLKARKFDMKKAEEMLRNIETYFTMYLPPRAHCSNIPDCSVYSIQKSYGTDTMLEDWEPPEALNKYWPGGVFGFDKLGHPILWQLSKDFDGKSMMKCVRKQDIVKYHVWRMEKVMKLCREQTKQRNCRIHSSMHISDLDGLNLGMIFMPGGMTEALKQIFAIFEANYPENLHSSYVINAPSIFPVIFNLLKPFLNEETKRKVHVLGRNWQEEIDKVVDKDQLPAFWGGTALAPDEKCSDYINHGCPIPQKYFISEIVGADREKMTTILVIRGNNYNLSYDVKMPGTLIRWIFETEGHDISFGVFYAKDRASYKKKTMTQELEKIRCDSHLAPEHGTHTCEKTGVYILQFDNSYSWVNSKTVHYEVEVLEPDTELFNNGGIGKTAMTNINEDQESLTGSLDSTHL